MLKKRKNDLSAVWERAETSGSLSVTLLSRIRIHIYFCDTVPLKACVNVLRKGVGHE